MAIAGFSKDDVTIEVRDSTLTVRGEKKPEKTEREFLHRGRSERAAAGVEVDPVATVAAA